MFKKLVELSRGDITEYKRLKRRFWFVFLGTFPFSTLPWISAVWSVSDVYASDNQGILLTSYLIMLALALFGWTYSIILEKRGERKILAKYGVEKGEEYEIINLDKK